MSTWNDDDRAFFDKALLLMAGEQSPRFEGEHPAASMPPRTLLDHPQSRRPPGQGCLSNRQYNGW